MSSFDHRYERDVLAYFKDKSDDYDMVEHQIYWRLSDSLLRAVMAEEVAGRLSPSFTFLDAGGGTGRWTAWLLRHFPDSRGLLYDLSPDMSQKAMEKGEAGGFSDRLTVQNGRLEEVGHALEGARFDLIFNFHNVLGFVQDVDSTVAQLAGLLRPGGLFISFVPNLYHTVFFNLFTGNTDRAVESLETGRGRFTAEMPAIHLFTPDGLQQLYQRHGLAVERLTGFPCAIYPGTQETQLRGSSPALADILERDFERIYRLERSLLTAPDVAARGNNIFALGRKEGA